MLMTKNLYLKRLKHGFDFISSLKVKHFRILAIPFLLYPIGIAAATAPQKSDIARPAAVVNLAGAAVHRPAFYSFSLIDLTLKLNFNGLVAIKSVITQPFI
jgi:hypothetical protein